MATYPSGIKSFTTKVSNDVIAASHINDMQDEITAIETHLLAVPVSYTPTWSAASVNPSLGNGTIAGSYVKIGRLVRFLIVLQMGGSTTFGTGGYSFSLPFAGVASLQNAAGVYQDASTGGTVYASFAYIFSSTVTPVFVDGATGAVSNNLSPTHPFTFAVSDVVQIAGSYISAT